MRKKLVPRTDEIEGVATSRPSMGLDRALKFQLRQTEDSSVQEQTDAPPEQAWDRGTIAATKRPFWMGILALPWELVVRTVMKYKLKKAQRKFGQFDEAFFEQVAQTARSVASVIPSTVEIERLPSATRKKKSKAR